MQAATRVKPEQAPKRQSRTPTWRKYREGQRGRGRSNRPGSPSCPPGYWEQHVCMARCATRETWAKEPLVEEGQIAQESEGPIVPMRRGNARGGTGPWFRVLHKEWTRGRLA